MGQTWNGDLLHDAGNVASDVVGFFSPPPGDPGRLRQIAGRIEGLAAEYEQDVHATNAAVNELTSTWGGDGAQAFAAMWHGHGDPNAPSQVLEHAHAQLQRFAQDLKGYADKLEHAQHDYWLQMAITGALTVVNAVQLGLDPATDAAEAGTVVAMKLGADFGIEQLSSFGIREAFVGLGSDFFAQLGADAWDRVDRHFDQTGAHAVSWLDTNELALSAIPIPAGSILGPARRLVARAPIVSDASMKAITRGTRAGSALKTDPYHAAPAWADPAEIAVSGREFPIRGADGTMRALVQAPATVNGLAGRFEWVIDADGTIRHELFVPNGKLNGVPIQP